MPTLQQIFRHWAFEAIYGAARFSGLMIIPPPRAPIEYEHVDTDDEWY